MSPVVNRFALFALLAASALAAVAVEPVVIARRGAADGCAIVIPAEPGPSVAYAADELQKYVMKLTGVKLRIVRGNPGVSESVVVLRPTDEFGDDGFRLQAGKRNSLRVSGGCRGVLYGVYEILETYGGCGWFASWHEVIPRLDRFEVPGDLDDVQKPAFEMRSTVWKDVKNNVDFGAKLRFNGHPCDGLYNLQAKHGGMPIRFVKGLPFCHTFHHVLSPGVYFKDHPEWFSEVKGVRLGHRTQICLTNPEAFEQAYSNICAKIDADLASRRAAGDDFAEKMLVAGVSQDDWHNYCECAACKAIDEREGSHAGSLLTFINRMADRLAARYSGMMTQTLIYQYTRKATKELLPNGHVIPILCSIECSFAHPLAERDDLRNGRYMDDLAAWSRRTKNLYVWDYTMGCKHSFYPLPNVHVLGPNIRTFRDYGARYLFEEGGAAFSYFAQLKAWMISKFAWNPDQPLEPLLDRFFKGHYGAAAPYMREYFDRCEAAVAPKEKKSFTIWENDRPDLYPDSFVDWARETLAKAENAVRDDPVVHRAVRVQAFGPLCMHLDRRGSKAKSVWVTRHPERFPDCSDLLPDIKRAFDLKEELAPLGGLQLGTTAKHSWDTWSKMREFKRPDSGCDKVTLGVREMVLASADCGEYVKDADAFKGECVRTFSYDDFRASATFSFGNVAFDDVPYVVRFRAKVEKGPDGKGEVFNAEFGGQRITAQADSVRDGWQWYEFPPMVLKDSFVFNYKTGRFTKGGGCGAVKCSYIDRLEIERK